MDLSKGFVEKSEQYPDNPDGEDIVAYIQEFARSDLGQRTLHEIEDFGLPGVESAVDLTGVQSIYLALARAERQAERNRQMRRS